MPVSLPNKTSGGACMEPLYKAPGREVRELYESGAEGEGTKERGIRVGREPEKRREENQRRRKKRFRKGCGVKKKSHAKPLNIEGVQPGTGGGGTTLKTTKKEQRRRGAEEEKTSVGVGQGAQKSGDAQK